MNKILTLTIVAVGFVAWLACASDNKITLESQNPKIEDIHAGAVFTNKTMKLILIQTWDKRYLLGNSWGNKYALYSTFAPTGATPQECCAYLRGEAYKYAGKAE